MAWKKYIYLYETDTVATGINFCLEDVKIETFNNERVFNIVSNIQRVTLVGRQATLSQSTRLVTNTDHTTILLTARTKEANIIDARKECTEALDRVITLLGNIYHPYIFDKKLYAGWDSTDASILIAETEVFRTDKIQFIDEGFVVNIYKRLINIADNYNKMSKLYAQAVSMPTSEDKFVKLWTILEIYPMQTKPGQRLELDKLYDLLIDVVGISKYKIKKRLKIHHEIYERYRCEIVHTGSTGFSEIELKDTIAKLELIVSVVLRSILGLPYNNELTEYL